MPSRIRSVDRREPCQERPAFQRCTVSTHPGGHEVIRQPKAIPRASIELLCKSLDMRPLLIRVLTELRAKYHVSPSS